jgi:putative peptide zinc metalloprotease protein
MVGTVEPNAVVLPPLREEVHCLPGPTQFDGAPSWTLHDPANNRFFRIGWLQFEILSRWALADAQRISEAVNQHTTLQISQGEVEQFYQFLLANHLLCLTGPQVVKRLWKQVRDSQQSLATRLIHNYLYFKIPLFKPDAMLARVYPSVAWIYSGWFALLIIACAVTGGILVSRQWEQFVNTFPYFFNWQGLSQYFMALALAKVLHELGHAMTAHRYGCRVPTMGVAFMAMYPMLYTDASETWKLTTRRQRLAVASAGIAAELGLAAFATLAWSFMEDGSLRSGVFLLASSTWIMTLIVNLSPFMRFDGYYLLSDWLRIENLQSRAFEYTRWQTRRWIFASNTPPPEMLSKQMAATFVIYSWGTWIYRFFLFLGIAWMVYHFFFKLLGILLMGVEIGWFILRPIWQELKHWRGLFKDSQQGWRLMSLVGLVVGGLLIPWQQHIEVPAQIKPGHYADIYLPYSARLDSWQLKPGQAVAEGDIVAELSSNELSYKQQTAQLEGDTLSWRLAFQGADAKRLKQRQVLLSQLDSATSKEAGLTKQLQQLQIQAPQAGKVLDINQQLQAGQWLKAGESLMTIGDDRGGYTIEAFVSEQDIKQLGVDEAAVFYPENPNLPPIKCRLQQIDDGSSVNLPNLLASSFGGPIATRVDQNKKNVPESAQYRVTLYSDVAWEKPALSPAILRGTVKIETERRNLIVRFWQQSLSVGFRESGF